LARGKGAEGRALSSRQDRPKEERFAAFLERLGSAPPASTFQEGYDQLCTVLNEVEDSLTSIPCNPENWQTDGRMYPPQPDSLREVEGHPDVRRFRSRRHNTFLGENGAIEIQTVGSEPEVVFAKAGADGKGVWQQ
jgi:hypothetical protein